MGAGWAALPLLQRPSFPHPPKQALSFRSAAFCAAALSLSQLYPTTRVLPRSTRVYGVGMVAISGSRSRTEVSSNAAITADVTRPARLTGRFDFWARLPPRPRRFGSRLGRPRPAEARR